MKKLGKIMLKGASGASYRFRVYPWESEFESSAAVYIVTKRKEKDGGKHTHSPLFAGQTEDLALSVADHRKSSALQGRDANCVCIHAEKSEVKRVEIESDVMALYWPPCNPAAGGERGPA